MAFPQTALPITAELYLNGAWTDITTDVYSRDPIRITRGRADEARQVDAGRCTLTLDNRAGKYSPRNPTGLYYGQLGRNTPIRVSVNAGASYLAVPGGTAPGVGASTPDAAALDIAGDIDVRIDVTMSNWVTSGVLPAVDLCGKYVTGTNQRSWFLQQRNGFPYLEWSPDGITTVQVSATIRPVIPVGGRQAWRATLDVNNGLGGYTVTFYTAPTIAGPWTQLDQTVTTSGTTSIFNSTSLLRVGDATDLTFARPNGSIHAFQLRNGIGGTLVANPDFTVQTPGAASFVDSTGKTWTVGTNTALSNRKTRFSGEVPAWPVKADTSGRDVYVQIEAAGILRRLGQGASPIQSAMRREFGNTARTGIVAYWPCEDGSQATSFASAHAGEYPMVISDPAAVNPATYSGWTASDPLPTFTSTTAIVRGSVVPYAATDWAFLRMFVSISNTPAASMRLASFTTTGTARTWSVFLDPAGLTLKAYDIDGTEILNSGALFDMIGHPRQIGVELSRNGTGIDWRLIVFFIEDGLTNASITGTLASRTIGAVTQVRMGEDGGLDQVSFGHIAVATTATAFASTGDAIEGWQGETASARIARLGREELVPVSVYAPGTEPLGAQRSQTLLTVLQEAATADHGILGEARGSTSLVYWDRVGLYNQGVTATLNYPTKGHVQPPLDPIDDDQNVRNDVTVTRIGGSSGRFTLTTGRMSVSDPPAGAGRYPDTPSLSLFADTQAIQHAAWLVHLGTVDEYRYPAVSVSLQAAPSLIDTVAALDTGARLQITNPSARLPPGTIDLIVQSYSELLSQYTWDITFNCTPASPYTVGVVEDAMLGRADTDGSQLSSGMTSTAISMSVSVTAGPLWITTASNPGDFPFDVLVGGERMTVTAITGATSPQTFTVTRSVNGVVKTQTSTTDVRLFQPTIVAL